MRIFRLTTNALDLARQDAIRHASGCLTDYYHARQAGSEARAEKSRLMLTRMNHESVLVYMTKAAMTPRPIQALSPDCRFALRTYPAVQRW